MKRGAPVFAILIAFPILTSLAIAQTPTASVVGRVTDSSGGVLPGVTVTIANPDTNQSTEAVTNGAGDYTILFLNPGSYVLEANLAGFRAYKRSEFTLVVEQDVAPRRPDGARRDHRDRERHRDGARPQYRNLRAG